MAEFVFAIFIWFRNRALIYGNKFQSGDRIYKMPLYKFALGAERVSKWSVFGRADNTIVKNKTPNDS